MQNFICINMVLQLQYVTAFENYSPNTRLAVDPSISKIYPSIGLGSGNPNGIMSEELYATYSGQYLVSRSAGIAPLYFSNDFGATFNATGSNVTEWVSVHISRQDGSTIAGVDKYGLLYRSRDYGVTFETLPNLLSGTRGDVAISNDCTHWIVGEYPTSPTCLL